jgi:hypothetical protein
VFFDFRFDFQDGSRPSEPRQASQWRQNAPVDGCKVIATACFAVLLPSPLRSRWPFFPSLPPRCRQSGSGPRFAAACRSRASPNRAGW